MSSKVIFGKEGSDESSTERTETRSTGWQTQCPECEGRVIAVDVEAVCTDCGLVVTEDTLDRSPGVKACGPDGDKQTGEWAVETTNDLRVDKGLHTTFFLATDGKGNSLSAERMDKMERLRQRHRRFTMQSDRHKRMNEGFRDIGMLSANLELPDHVTTDAARYLEAAKDARLPGGRMAWESLAAGAVLLAGRANGIERTPAQIARFAKSSRERVCAAARKIRLQTSVDAPVVRDRAVDRVVTALDEAGVDLETGIELVRVGEELLDVADTVPIGAGTTRMTVAGAAVYAADRLTPGKALTQADVVRAVRQTVPTSKHRIKRYSQEVYEAGETHLRPTDAVADLVADD